MSEVQATATVKELPPEASARDILNLDDGQLLEAVGLKAVESAKETPKPKEEAEKQVAKPVEEKPAEEKVEAEAKAEGEEEVVEKDEEQKEEAPKKTYNFKVADKEGELEVPDDLVFDFTANGKLREKVPLDKVIQLAQMGYYNHEKELELEAREAATYEKVSQAEQAYQLAKQYEKALQTVLSDPDRYDDARLRFLEMNTPEAKARREREVLEQERTQLQTERDAVVVGGFIEKTLVPHMTSLLEKHSLVSEDEVMGRYGTLTQRLLVNGKLPPERLGLVKQIVETELTAWVQQRQLDREEKLEASKAEQRKLEAEAKRLKRQVARNAAPTGGAAPDAPKPKTYESARDWLKGTFPTQNE